MSELQPRQELQLLLRLHWSRSRPADIAYQQVSALQTSMNLEFIGSRLPVERAEPQFLILWETLRAFVKKIIYASMP
jgi:hypothetical protein